MHSLRDELRTMFDLIRSFQLNYTHVNVSADVAPGAWDAQVPEGLVIDIARFILGYGSVMLERADRIDIRASLAGDCLLIGAKGISMPIERVEAMRRAFPNCTISLASDAIEAMVPQTRVEAWKVIAA